MHQRQSLPGRIERFSRGENFVRKMCINRSAHVCGAGVRCFVSAPVLPLIENICPLNYSALQSLLLKAQAPELRLGNFSTASERGTDKVPTAHRVFRFAALDPRRVTSCDLPDDLFSRTYLLTPFEFLPTLRCNICRNRLAAAPINDCWTFPICSLGVPCDVGAPSRFRPNESL